MQQAIRNRLQSWNEELSGAGLVRLLARFGDVFLVLLVVSIVGMMLVPLPPRLLDILLTCNITLAVTILMVSMYIGDATQLASFPTILLLTTLFRLALNISSTRLILGEGYAGEVIRSFGMFVAGGNIVVGIVIFLILTLIQFIVITKGSERIAEVSARFTLDALPGKQMAIDADLRAGLIEVQEARARRASLQRESQLYGAMDGAMKFVKGDAIAGIVITLINIIGGLLIGVLMRDMELARAGQLYTILTIGDGLVSQIPSLLISVSAGMVTSRVASEEKGSNVGREVTVQLLSQPKAIAVVACLLLALALIPGLPTFPFLVLAALTGALAYGLMRARAAEQAEQEALQKPETAEPEVSLAVPVVLELSSELSAHVDQESEAGKPFSEKLNQVRSSLYYETGVLYPALQVKGNSPLPANSYRVWLFEAPILSGTLPSGCSLVGESAQRLAVYGLSGQETVNPLTGRPATWVPVKDAERAARGGVPVWSVQEVLILITTRVQRKYACEFIGIQEVQWVLDQLAKYFPKLVEEVVPRLVSVQQLVEILKRLVEEDISIRDIKSILEALGEWARVEQDTVALTEQVRVALKRKISFQLTEGNPTLYVYQLDPTIEEMVRNAIRQTTTGSYLMLSPEDVQKIHRAVFGQIGYLPPTAQRPVILTENDVRRYVRKLLETNFPDLAVLSYQELTPDITVQPLAFISISSPSERRA